MNADDEPEDEIEEVEYEPLAAQMADGDVLIMDPVELCELCNAIAMQARDGILWVLKRNGEWVNVSDALKPARATVVQAVKTRQ